jgi:hypothetical protein
LTTVKDKYGNIYRNKKPLFFSIDEFVNRIANNPDRCFVCGGLRSEKHFNDEHILPDWILKSFKLHNRKITLPNLSSHKYMDYKIPCCKDCNSHMGKVFEEPISKALKQGHEGVVNFLKEEVNNSHKIFMWLCLIFTKTHIKDSRLLLNRDRRNGNDSVISDAYGLEITHHIYCLARSFYTGAQWLPPNMGSLIYLPAKLSDKIEQFDYFDWVDTGSIMIRVNDIAIIAVLNDCGAVLGMMTELLDQIKGPLSPLQIREVFAHFSYCSSLLKNRPNFNSYTTINEYVIKATMDDFCFFNEGSNDQLGIYLHNFCSGLIKKAENYTEVEESLKSGNWTCLTDKEGNFINDSMIIDNEEV